MKDDLPTTVNGCARCGKDHTGLVYRKMQRPVPDVDGDFEYWAPCPVTSDPILMRFNDADALRDRMRRGRIILSACRAEGEAWSDYLSVAELADVLRQPHEAKQWDAKWVYIDHEAAS